MWYVLVYTAEQGYQGERFSREYFYVSDEDHSINNSLVHGRIRYHSKEEADKKCRKFNESEDERMEQVMEDIDQAREAAAEAALFEEQQNAYLNRFH